ncbi:MAG: hypothetical protein J7L38_00945 [Thermoproteales archaeon]|nr:hypothetical protein [Thermoproteales archaeon]
MPLVCKIFKLTQPLELYLIASKLKDFRQVYLEKIEEEEVELGYRIRDLRHEDNILSGVFEDSFIIELPYRGVFRKVPVSRDSPFYFVYYMKQLYLVIGAKKLKANRLANVFSEILYAERGKIIEARITHDVLKALHEAKPDATKVIYFDDLRVPSLSKLALYGPGVSNAYLYSEYLKLGKIWYAVFETEEGWVIGVTRNCVVTCFTKTEEENFYSFVIDKIIPLAYESEKEVE